jgi:hypothetical protein
MAEEQQEVTRSVEGTPETTGSVESTPETTGSVQGATSITDTSDNVKAWLKAVNKGDAPEGDYEKVMKETGGDPTAIAKWAVKEYRGGNLSDEKAQQFVKKYKLGGIDGSEKESNTSSSESDKKKSEEPDYVGPDGFLTKANKGNTLDEDEMSEMKEASDGDPLKFVKATLLKMRGAKVSDEKAQGFVDKYKITPESLKK